MRRLLLRFWIFHVFTLQSVVTSERWGLPTHFPIIREQSVHRMQKSEQNVLNRIRGGDKGHTEDDGDDHERYSRQVYTLGARAHGLVRSTTIYIDGPSQSGLLYECAKNLALSGAGHIIIVTSDNNQDSNYFNSQLDDLGKTYFRAAYAELGMDGSESSITDERVLQEYLKRLNPSVTVAAISRSDLNTNKIASGVLLCVDRPYDTQLKLNELARKRGFAYLAVETAGIHGRIFCDFGTRFEIYDVDGEAPLVVPLDHVEIFEEENNTVYVNCVDGESHDVSKGDKIEFQGANGESICPSLAVKNVRTPHRFSAQLDQSESISLDSFIGKVNAQASTFRRIKTPQTVSFLPLEQAMEKLTDDSDLFTSSDLDKSFDSSRRSTLFACFQALSTFAREQNKLPSAKDFTTFWETVQSSTEALDSLKDPRCEDYGRVFVRCCAAKFVPLQAIFGAIAAQEALKAATGLYNPIRQFLLFDCDEVLDTSKDECPSDEDDSTMTGQAYIMGKDFQAKFKSKHLFVVGAGAIGCELLKNLAAMDAGSRKNGCVILTDMDTIERSNLSRQLLFRDSDIGKFKSIAAQEAIHRFNPNLKIECHTSKVGGEDNGTFDENFWLSGPEVILNALDNVEARLYMDSQCVANELAMVDAGTLGSKGNVQVVVPSQSESYGSSPDPPEPAIPVCTLKNFPYAIAHTIQWGRDLFDGLFARRSKQANDYRELLSSVDASDFAAKLLQDFGEEAAISASYELGQDLAPQFIDSDLSDLRVASIAWAIMLAKKLFSDSVEALIRKHPVDSLDEDGEPFWSGPRKLPKPLSFLASEDLDAHQNSVNQNIIDFVRSSARLRIETFAPQAVTSGVSVVTQDEVEQVLLHQPWASIESDEDNRDTDTLSQVYNNLSQIKSGLQALLHEAEFEKDNDANGHVEFVTAASNLRAICYGIPPVDAMETRRVAGKIVPAMITTTAFVSALSCIELLKLITGGPLGRYRNAFINLALPFFAFTVPLPAEEMSGLPGQVYTIWDRIIVKESKKAAAGGGITLRRLLKRIKKKACDDPDSIEICTVSFGEFMIYANFLHDGDDEILDKNFWQLVEESVALGQAFDNQFSRDAKDSEDSSGNSYRSSVLDLTVIVEDVDTGEEFQLAPVRLLKWKQ